jgi:hypothetical protein
MNVVARQTLSEFSYSNFVNGLPALQAFDLLWCDVRSTSRRI